MKENIVLKKSESFSLQVISTYKLLLNSKEYVMSTQLLKSATSIGANISEPRFAQSKKDFLSKIQIALKEANETKYWLKLLYLSNYIPDDTFTTLSTSCSELILLLSKITKTTKLNLSS